jgi:hypothetical protein
MRKVNEKREEKKIKKEAIYMCFTVTPNKLNYTKKEN